MSLVFADSPSGGGKDERSDASERRSFLLQKKARSKKTSGPSAGAWVKSNRPAMQKAYPPLWFDGRMASLKAMWSDLYPPQVSAQLVLEF